MIARRTLVAAGIVGVGASALPALARTHVVPDALLACWRAAVAAAREASDRFEEVQAPIREAFLAEHRDDPDLWDRWVKVYRENGLEAAQDETDPPWEEVTRLDNEIMALPLSLPGALAARLEVTRFHISDGDLAADELDAILKELGA